MTNALATIVAQPETIGKWLVSGISLTTGLGTWRPPPMAGRTGPPPGGLQGPHQHREGVRHGFRQELFDHQQLECCFKQHLQAATGLHQRAPAEHKRPGFHPAIVHRLKAIHCHPCRYSLTTSCSPKVAVAIESSDSRCCSLFCKSTIRSSVGNWLKSNVV